MPTATTQTVKKRCRIQKNTTTVTRVLREHQANKSGESADESDQDDQATAHHNVHGLPIDAADAFADAVAGDDEAEVVDTDSVFNEHTAWTQCVVHDEDRSLRNSSQQTKLPVFHGASSCPQHIPEWAKKT